MIDPNDFPRLKLTIGEKVDMGNGPVSHVQVFNRNGQLILRFTAHNDLAAIKNGIRWIDDILDLRKQHKDIL